MPELPRFGVQGQVALVTGAARGLGRAIALALAAAGADVVLGLRDASADGGVAADLDFQVQRARLHTSCHLGTRGAMQTGSPAQRRVSDLRGT
jgi:NAD(P)-dependent dehydrogenase (short-subunit alcohol dehydrogenase family)